MRIKLNADQQAVLDRNPELNPAHIPKTWNGMADLDEKIYRAEQAFLEEQKGRQLALTPPAPKPKANNYVTQASLNRQLRASCEEIGKGIGQNVLKPFDARIKSLEEKPVMEFQGPWKPKQPYRKGSVVVHDGSCWVAKEGGTGHRPGTDDGATQWALAAKKGRDAR